jgi:hypothetical protein
MLYGCLENALTLGAHASDTVRKELAAVVQKALEDTNVAIIDIRDITQLQWIDLLLQWIAAVLTAEALTTTLIAATLTGTTTLRKRTLLCHVSILLLRVQFWLRKPFVAFHERRSSHPYSIH